MFFKRAKAGPSARPPATPAMTAEQQAQLRAFIKRLLPFADAGSAELPLSRAAYWVTGRPGSADVRARDAAGRVAVLTEQSWRVEFTEYDGESPDALPRQIDASDGEHSFRLRIDAWYPLP